MLLRRIVGRVMMALLFFALVTPVALVLRIFGRDPLRLKLEPAKATYWIDRIPPGPSPQSIKNQF